MISFKQFLIENEILEDDNTPKDGVTLYYGYKKTENMLHALQPLNTKMANLLMFIDSNILTIFKTVEDEQNTQSLGCAITKANNCLHFGGYQK